MRRTSKAIDFSTNSCNKLIIVSIHQQFSCAILIIVVLLILSDSKLPIIIEILNTGK